MRVCLVSRRYWPAVSGMSVYAENLLTELTALGHQLTMVSQYRGDPEGTAIYGGGPPPAERIPPGVAVCGLEAVGEQAVTRGEPADFESDIATMRDLVVKLHHQAPFDVLHAQYGWPTGMAVLQAGAELGVPTVVSIQGGDGHWVGTCCRTHKIAMTTVLDHADRVLIGSQSFAEEVTGHHGTSPDRFTVIPGATDTTRFAPLEARPPGSLQDPPVVLFHGRVDRRKGVLDLLDAVKTITDQGETIRVIISGIGPDSAAAAQRAIELGITELVTQPGYIGYDDAPEVYRRADLFASPTYSEGFSNTVLEAMATGLPVLSTDVVGVRDCLRDGDNGLLVPPADVPALAAGLTRLLHHSALRERLAATALAEVRARYSWPVLAAAIEDQYVQLAGTRPDTSWVAGYGAGPEVDPTCRFRTAPHLL